MVEAPGAGVRVLGRNPGLEASKLPATVQKQLDQLAPNTSSLMAWRHTNLVDPKLDRLIRMHVVYGGRKPHQQPAVQGGGYMMPRVGQEFRSHATVDRIAEDFVCDLAEELRIVSIEKSDFDSHSPASQRLGLTQASNLAPN